MEKDLDRTKVAATSHADEIEFKQRTGTGYLGQKGGLGYLPSGQYQTALHAVKCWLFRPSPRL
jgi:hypothetical protein